MRTLLRQLLGLAALAGLVGCDRAGHPAGPDDLDGGSAQPARTLTVAAAADLKFALPDVAAEFGKSHPDVVLKITYGSSGNFYAQLSQRAPFDVFLSADLDYPRRLVEAGHAEPASLARYAVGRIVLWVPNGSRLDLTNGWEGLRSARPRTVAIANPKHAPYGRAAEAALRRAGLWEALSAEKRLVFGENIAQTAQFVQSGSAEVGVLALSLAEAPALKSAGRYWLIPEEEHLPLEQGGCVTRWAADPGAARDFLALLAGPSGRAILARYGFAAPTK